MVRVLSGLLIILALLSCVRKELLGRVLAEETATKPTITINHAPPKGAGPDVMETIAGSTSGVDVTKCKVVIFAHTNTWYVQPYAASPYTAITEDGKWETRTHLGDEYAALLVETTYEPPATTDRLPEVGGSVLAITKAAASGQSSKERSSAPRQENSPEANDSATSRTIQFSGYTWRVKSSSGQVGPGPNYFSDSSDNVEVDANGRLHLRITKRDGRWYCAEIISARSFGYGSYRFYVGTKVDDVDPRVVLGMFTWSDDPAHSHREIDIEISKWGDGNNRNAQFVVQPYTKQTNIVRFEIPLGLTGTTHVFDWRADSVFCQSLKGFHHDSAEASSIVQQHSFTDDIPVAGGENARINLWLVNGDPPSDGKTLEIIIVKFEFHRRIRGKEMLGSN